MRTFLLILAALMVCSAPIVAVASPPSAAALEAAGATVKQDASGGIVEVRFRGPAVDAAILQTLPELPSLTSVVVAGTDVNDAALAPLGKIATLKNLDLRDCPISNAGLAHLVNLKDLAALRLSGKNGKTVVDDAGMVHASKITSLRALMLDFLWVSEVGLVGDDALPVIARFPAIKRLRIAKTTVTAAGLTSLEKLPNLVDLDLSECVSIDDAALEPVGKVTSLERLNLWRVPVGDDGVAHLAPLTNLRWLNLDNTQLTDAGLEALAGMKQLEYLHVGSTAVSNDGLDRLAAIPSLREIFLTRTSVDAAGAAGLQQRLPKAKIVVEYGSE
jgi:Leucine-rich repeat (LRR) protein